MSWQRLAALPYARRMRRPHAAVLAVVTASLIAGCGDTKIDDAKGEKLISDLVEKQIGAQVASVKCPEDVVAKKGATFTCSVVAGDKSKGDARVTAKDAEGNVNVSAPFLHIRDAESAIAQQLSERFKGAVKVACREIVVVEKGNTFPCKATSGSDSRDVAVTLTDDTGRFTYKLT